MNTHMRARAHTHTHTRLPNSEKVKAQRIRSNTKRRQRNKEKTNNIAKGNIAGAREGVLARFGQVNSIGRDIRRQHGQNMEFPPIPENAVFKIPAPFHTSSTGEKFSDLFYHYSSVHVVIYCTWTSPGKGDIAAYFLFTSKGRQTYLGVLAHRKTLINQVNPISMVIYFEQIMIGKLSHEYPVVLQKGCRLSRIFTGRYKNLNWLCST